MAAQTKPEHLSETIDAQQLARRLLSDVSFDTEQSTAQRDSRLSEFAVLFAKAAVRREDQVISTMRLIGDRWSNLILSVLRCGMFRHSELQRVINSLASAVEAPPISQRVLTQKLRKFERDGLVTRTVRPTVPVRTEYRLTALGAEFTEFISQLTQWSLAHREAVAESQRKYDREHLDL